MIQLIYKDITFNKRNICISILVSIIGYYCISIDGEAYKTWALTLIPILMFSLFIGKLCFIEDRDKVYKYIQALPLKKSYFVMAKYLEGIIVLVLSFVLIFTENFIQKIINKHYYNFNFKYVSLIFSLMLIYIGIFFLLYFIFNYMVANQTLVLLLVLCLIGSKLLYSAHIDINKIINFKYFNVILLLISFINYMLTYELSKYFYYIKEG